MLDHCRTMARYNRWMNARIYEACARLSDDDRKRDMGAFFGSIHGTLNHLLLVDRLWMGRFLGEPYPIRSLDQELCSGFATLREEREREDARIVEWIDSLCAEDVEGELTYTSAMDRQPRHFPFRLALAHFFNHQTHHRGQVTTLLSQNGVDPGVTDLIWLPEETRPR